MEDYKEKLRLAKEALDSGSYDKETIEYIFPELKESEDEIIMKECISIIDAWDKSCRLQGDYCEVAPKCIAWLEKQDKNEEINEASYRAGIKRVLDNPESYGLEKQGEQKPADKVVEEEKSLLEKYKQAVYDCAWGKVTCRKEGETKEEYANRWAEQLLILVRDWADDYIDSREDAIIRRSFDKGKQSIQKPAWSEEDEKQARQIERIVHNDGCSQKLQEQIAVWLKSLKKKE